MEHEAKPKGAQAVPGLRRMRAANAERKPEWDRPNAKALRRIRIRIRDYDKRIADTHELEKGYHRPGSAKR